MLYLLNEILLEKFPMIHFCLTMLTTNCWGMLSAMSARDSSQAAAETESAKIRQVGDWF